MEASSPVFVSILSQPYSGATLLAMLLAAHPEVATVGEMNGPNPSRIDVDTYKCSCGQLIRQCEFWHAVEEGMRDKGFEFDVGDFNTRFLKSHHSLKARLLRGSLGSNTLESVRDSALRFLPGQVDQLRLAVARNEAFVRAVLEVTGKHVFVDTSKSPWRCRYLARMSTLNVRAIHLVRNVNGVAASVQRRGRANATEAARNWVRGNIGLERLTGLLPEERRIRFHYESLCTDPENALRSLYRFCEVDPSFQILDLQSISDHHVIGNPMRLRNLSEIRVDERWKEELTAQQLEEIGQIAASSSRRYGCR